MKLRSIRFNFSSRRGEIRFNDEHRRVHKVMFDIDDLGNWEQWNECKDILWFTMPLVEDLAKYLSKFRKSYGRF